MNAKDWKPIHKELLTSLPGFAAHKTLLLMTPIAGMLRAVHFDLSAFSKDNFDGAKTIMPLCIPKSYA